MHRDTGTDDEVGRCEATSHATGFLKSAQSAQVRGALPRIVVSSTVVLVEVSGLQHQQIGASHQHTCVVTDVDLRLDVDLGHLVKDA